MPGSVPQFIDALRVYDQSLHMVSTQHVAVDDDSAVGEAYCDAHYILGSNDLVMAVRYDDEFRRIDGAWLFLRRRVNVMWTSERPVTLPA
jgi:SnoaL-like domain